CLGSALRWQRQDRRCPYLLAAPQARRVGHQSAVSPHSARGRSASRRPRCHHSRRRVESALRLHFGRRRARARIRRTMAFMAAVVTGAVVLAFCIPLAVFVRSVAYDRAIDNADLEARSLAAELSMVNSAAAVERLLLLADGAADTTPATVYLRNGQIFGRLRGTPG